MWANENSVNKSLKKGQQNRHFSDILCVVSDLTSYSESFGEFTQIFGKILLTHNENRLMLTLFPGSDSSAAGLGKVQSADMLEVRGRLKGLSKQ